MVLTTKRAHCILRTLRYGVRKSNSDVCKRLPPLSILTHQLCTVSQSVQHHIFDRMCRIRALLKPARIIIAGSVAQHLAIRHSDVDIHAIIDTPPDAIEWKHPFDPFSLSEDVEFDLNYTPSEAILRLCRQLRSCPQEVSPHGVRLGEKRQMSFEVCPGRSIWFKGRISQTSHFIPTANGLRWRVVNPQRVADDIRSICTRYTGLVECLKLLKVLNHHYPWHVHSFAHIAAFRVSANHREWMQTSDGWPRFALMLDTIRTTWERSPIILLPNGGQVPPQTGHDSRQWINDMHRMSHLVKIRSEHSEHN